MFFILPFGLLAWPFMLRFFVDRSRQTQYTFHQRDALFGILLFMTFVGSFFLPDIGISTETTTFQQHAVGGGMTVFLAYLHARQLINWRLYWWQEVLAMYATISAIGVANELLEFFITKSGLGYIDSSDVWWDLLANTSGMCIAAAVYFGVRYIRTRKIHHE